MDLLATIPAYLEQRKAGMDELTGNEWITGRLGNLRVIVTQNAVTVKDGSLTKWYLNDNLKMMSRGDIQRAFEKLSDCLHLPMFEADVKRLDFGKNIMLNHAVTAYLPYLGSNGRYTRLEQKTAVNYKITGRELCFYDKVAEIKSRGENVPALYEGRAVGRYEKRYLHNIPKYFRRRSVNGHTLYDEHFYSELINDWYKDYLSIQKQKTVKIDLSMITTKEQMKMLGVLSLVEMQGGKLAALQNIKERQLRKELTKKQAHDLKELIELSTKLKLQTKESDLIIEFDGKMREAVKYFR
ncbi:MAG TPA: phage/plasmid replication protein [Flavisolibacter sp.]|nr:phage/plasmid replication protein [Flavisolibacter sp.]